VLVGRDAERESITALLDAARAGTGGALVLRGIAGSGKSTLLAAAAAEAADMQVLRTSGVESESPLAFAAVQRLLRPLRARFATLPAPQRSSLLAALGEAAGEGDRFLAFLGTLNLLADAAEESPVLVVADDAHWLDDASAAALLFVARRLQAERVAMLFGVRDGAAYRFAADDLPAVVLGGLTGDAADAMLAALSGGPVDREVRDRLVAATGGNPLALGELAGALGADRLAGSAPLPAQLPITGGIERGFLDRIRRLDEPAQRFLLVAATDDTGRGTVVRDAAARLDAGDEALDAVERVGLLRLSDGEVRLFHPLVRSAVYGAATSAQRRAAHRALADVLRGDPDRQAWHAAAAADRADEPAAAALDAVAVRATGRAGHEAAASAWARAAELTADPAARGARFAAAAQAAWFAAQPTRARSLADAALMDVADPVLRSDLHRLRARVDWNLGSPLVGSQILLRAADEVAPFDLERARAMTMLAAAVTSVAKEGAEEMSARAAALGDPATAPVGSAQGYARLLAGFVHIRGGRFDLAAAVLRPLFADWVSCRERDLLANIGIAALHLGDERLILDLHARQLGRARESGALVAIVHELTRRAFGEIAVGDWAAAAAGAAEALDLATGSGQPALSLLPHAWLALIGALRNHPDQVAEHLTAIEKVPSRGVTGPIVAELALWTRALGADNPAGALASLRQLTDFTGRLAAFDRLEAAVQAGQPDLARSWVAELDAFGAAVGARWALSAASFGRGLLGDGDAVGHFETAVEHADAAGHRFERARAQLAYGEYLRRARRRVDARARLRASLEVFDDLGATRWATRATTELRASGESARRRDSDTAQLTAQERQVAGLVRQGLSNRDAAARLFLSPRTVDFHLRNVFNKLGVASRAELTALPADAVGTG
jgi:DNA-binding CsgD family transcriptional regulator